MTAAEGGSTPTFGMLRDGRMLNFNDAETRTQILRDIGRLETSRYALATIVGLLMDVYGSKVCECDTIGTVCRPCAALATAKRALKGDA